MYLSPEFTCFTSKYLTVTLPLKILKKILIYSLISLSALAGLGVSMLYIYKDDIIYLATMQINKHLNTKVDVAKQIDISIFEKFPELSIGFHDVKFYEPGVESSTVFASLKDILITFNVIDIWNGNYKINTLYLNKGYVHLRTNPGGDHNFMIFKKDTSKTASNKDFSISSIELNEIDCSYEYKPSLHRYQAYIKSTRAVLSLTKNVYAIHVDGDWHSEGFILKDNTFLQNKDIQLSTDLSYDSESETFIVKPSKIKINTSAYDIKGLYDIKKYFIDLTFHADKNDIHAFSSILPKAYTSTISEYQSKGNIYFNGTVKGTINDTLSPAIDVNFGFDHATFYHPGYKQTITDAFLTGTFSNGTRHNLTTSRIKLSDIKLKVDDKLIEGYFHLTNFDDPFVETQLKGGVVLSNVLKIIPNHLFESAEGEIDFDIEFKGKVNDLKSRAGYENIETAGDLTFHHVKTKLASYPHIIAIEEASCLFTKNDISIDNMHLAVGKNEIVLNGIFRNLIGKIIFPEQSVYVQADLEMGNIFLEDILMSDTRSNKSSNQDFIMPALKDYKFELNLKAASMNYQKFHATKVLSKIEWSYPYLNFTNAGLSFCNGTYTGKMSLKVVNEKTVEINTDSKIRAMDIDSLFYVFENFSQNFITNKNLKGKISSDVSLILQLDNHLTILPSSIICDADVTIQNGELNNFETMKRISRFLDAEDLSNIKFSEIKNHFLIYNQEIQIPDMTISSSVGKISLSGTHGFDGKIEYHVAYPIKNLKKEKVDSDAAFGALRQDPKGEMKLFLIIQGTTTDFKIIYDKKKTGEKIKADLQKEKEELKSLFKKKEADREQIKQTQQQEQEYFDFD